MAKSDDERARRVRKRGPRKKVRRCASCCRTLRARERRQRCGLCGGLHCPQCMGSITCRDCEASLAEFFSKGGKVVALEAEESAVVLRDDGLAIALCSKLDTEIGRGSARCAELMVKLLQLPELLAALEAAIDSGLPLAGVLGIAPGPEQEIDPKDLN